MARDKWQLWALRWVESGGSIEDARTVGRWIAHGGLDWLQRRSKTDHLAQSWADCLGKALDCPKTRANAAARAGEALAAIKISAWSESVPQEAREGLARFGFGQGEDRK